jgi:hypothetical protein
MKFIYEGFGSTRTYPHRQHPEGPGVLQADPGEVIDFGEESPPDDGFWYPYGNGEGHTPPDIPSVPPLPGTGDGSQEEAS